MKLVKDITKAKYITHAGTMHADEVFATAFLDLYKKDVVLTRVTEIDNTKKALETNDTAKIKEATEKLTKVFYDMSEQLYKNANPNGAAGANDAGAQTEGPKTDANGNGNVYDADYKVEDDNDKK